MPHIHIIIGLMLNNTLHLEFYPSLFVLIGSVLPDADFIVAFLVKKNHRSFFTHYPIVWVLATVVSSLFSSILFWFFLAGLIHTVVDVVDWDVFIYRPISDRKYSLLSLDPTEVLQTNSIIKSIVNYYGNHQIILIELVIIILCILSFLIN